jgi:hypothetical protein
MVMAQDARHVRQAKHRLRVRRDARVRHPQVVKHAHSTNRMRLLLKFPTRSRPQQALRTLQAYCNMATSPELIGIAMSCDADDDSMSRTLVQDEFIRTMGRVAWNHIFYGNSKTKIEACNANMIEIAYPWDIVMLVSDDMIPIVKGYDDVIRSHMLASFPDTNGTLWFNDGHQENKLNTLSVMGRKMYDSFGYIYHPSSPICVTGQSRTSASTFHPVSFAMNIRDTDMADLMRCM